MVPLSDLLANDVEEVLKTPLLRQAVISYTRKLFYGGRPVQSCDSSCRNYFRRLQLEGTAKQEKLLNMKYQLKPDIAIVFDNQTYNASTITDEIAKDYLKKFPKAKGNFNILKDDDAPVPAAPKAVAPVVPLVPKAPEAPAPVVPKAPTAPAPKILVAVKPKAAPKRKAAPKKK